MDDSRRIRGASCSRLMSPRLHLKPNCRNVCVLGGMDVAVSEVVLDQDGSRVWYVQFLDDDGFENRPMLCADTTLLKRGANARLQIVEILRGHLNPVSNATLAVDLEDDDVASLLVSPVSASRPWSKVATASPLTSSS
jgi:hypothetical protein